MGVLKVNNSSDGLVHFSVGAIIKKGKKYLIVDRAEIPRGFACIAGHLEKGETPEQAVIREVREESHLKVKETKLLFEETLRNNLCGKGANNHHWYVFSCEVEGKEKRNSESKSIGWYTSGEIKKLELEPSWKIILKELRII